MSADIRLLTRIVLAVPLLLAVGAALAQGAGLRILWPLRIRSIPAHEMVEAVALSRETFRREFGWGSRIGAGGLWGGFGWVYTRKGWVGLYVSRTDRFVLLRLRTNRPLLVTPEDGERFVAALGAVSRGLLPRDAAPTVSPG